MRLFLHGRSEKNDLLEQLKEAKEKDCCDERSVFTRKNDDDHHHNQRHFFSSYSSLASSSVSSSSSPSSAGSGSISTATATNNCYYYSSVLLSNWNVDEIDDEIMDSFEEFLRNNYHDQQKQQIKERRRSRRRSLRDQKFNDSSSCSLFSSMSSQISAISHDNEEEEESDDEVYIMDTNYIHVDYHCFCNDVGANREVILHNCTGESEKMERLIVLLMDTATAITIRYDKQREFPKHIAKGLHVGANTLYSDGGDDSNANNSSSHNFCRLRSLTLKGMTITPSAANHLYFALPLLPNLEELTIQGKFTLMDLDRKNASIAGNAKSVISDVALFLHKTLKELSSQLKLLDLQRCHLPDEYLAFILDGLSYNPLSIRSLETLKLNGNMAHEESQTVLCYKLLNHPDCRIKHLDLSWQRLPNAKRNIGVFDATMLSRVMANPQHGNVSLKTLNLSDNRLHDKDVALLSAAISRHANVRKVILQNCYMTDHAFMDLADRIPQCGENLKCIMVDGMQQIKNKSLVRKSIFQALLKNVYLKELVVPYSCESDVLSWALEFNRAGRRALKDTSIPVQVATTNKVNNNNNNGDNLLFNDDPDDIAIECTINSSIPFIDSRRSHSQVSNALWPVVYERADRIARRTYCNMNEKESSTSKSASAVYLLLREKGYQSLLQ